MRSPGPPGWGLGVGLTTLLHKNTNCYKTRSVVNETTLTGDDAASTAMTALGHQATLLEHKDHGGGKRGRKRKRTEFQCL